MPPLKKLINFLDKRKAKYKIITHKKVYTTFDAAQTQKIPLKMLAKTLLVKGDNKFVFAVIPGHRKLDVRKLKQVMNKYFKKMGEKKIRKLCIATETQIKRNITKKIGALPPFGSLFNRLTFVDKLLLKNPKLNLNAGSFTDSLEMTSAQYKKVEQPVEGNFSK